MNMCLLSGKSFLPLLHERCKMPVFFTYLIGIMSFLNVLCMHPYSFEKITIFNKDCYNGPNSVVLSLLRGLQQFPIKYTRNPELPTDCAPIVVVLSDVEYLAKVIAWKQAGYVTHIFAGPNLMHRSHDCDRILARDEVDIVLVPSEWVLVSYIQDDECLRNKIRVWYAGVDEQQWKPLSKSKRAKSNNVLIYVKNDENSLSYAVERLLKQYQWNPIRLNYGSYIHADYYKLLSEVSFAVFLSRSESQGISLAEAWAMDVPTLVWNPQDLVAYGKKFDPISSSPYLTNYTGMEWKTEQDLEQLLKTMHKKLPTFSPRSWVLQHMTDLESVDRLLTIIESTVAK